MSGRAGRGTAADGRDRGGWLAVVSVGTWLVAVAVAGFAGAWLAVGGVAVALAIAAALQRPRRLGTLLRPNPSRVLLGLAVGAALTSVSLVAYARLAEVTAVVAVDAARLYETAFPFGVEGPQAVLLTVLAFAPIVLAEEIVWRGVVQTAYVRRFGAFRGVAAAAATYALATAPFASPLLVLAALAWGVVWGVLRVSTESLVPGFIAHWVWNGLLLVTLPLVTSAA